MRYLQIYIKRYLLQTLLFTLVLAPIVYTTSLFATTATYGTYLPNRQVGLYKMSTERTLTQRGTINVATNRCDSQITNAYSKIRSSTKATYEMPTTIWPSGYNLLQDNCNGQSTLTTDMTLLISPHSGSVGQTYSRIAPSSYCSLWNAPTSQCGYIITIEIDNARWDSLSYQTTPTLKQRVVMHEFGHGVGMKDNCTEDSIMNNGSAVPGTNSQCNPRSSDGKAKWLEVMSYLATDRSAIKAIYR